MPIPRPGQTPYAALNLPTHLLTDLTKNRLTGANTCHLDPDLAANTLPRPAGWQPLFGQAGASQQHLANHHVSQGDLFLFFGWFRQTEQINARYRYAKDAPNLHVLFGWLEIKTVIHLDHSPPPPWAKAHPHCQPNFPQKHNTLYIGRTAGLFTHFHPDLCLTAPGRTRALWQLPRWFYPHNRPPLTYHRQLERWTLTDTHAMVRSPGRGQEFILDTTHYPEAIPWTQQLIRQHGAPQ